VNAPASITTLQVPAAIGDAFEGGFYGGQVRIGEAVYAIIWAPKAQGETQGAWLPTYTGVPGARSCCDSAANTAAMLTAGSALATWVQALDINGHSDWVIPARDVLELAYRHLKPTTEETGCYFRDGDNPSSVPVSYPYKLSDTPPVQTLVLPFQEGQAEAFEEEIYWSSTQYDADNAWFQGFSYGSQVILSKSYEARVRAVRMIQLT
jgi:hypothetical protein